MRPASEAPQDEPILGYGVCEGEISGEFDEPQLAVVSYIGDSPKAGRPEGFDWSVCAADQYAVWMRVERWMPLPSVEE